MSIARAQVDFGGNNVQAQPVGATVLAQLQYVNDTTVGAATIAVNAILAGITNRTGPTAGFTDTFPTADLLLAAQPELTIGDSFTYIYRNTVAFAMTAAAGEGVILGSNVDIAASTVREYLLTVLGIGPRQIAQGTLTNASPNITGIPLAIAAQLKPGQGVSGTGITAGTFLLSVNAALGTAVMSANATAPGTVAITSFPRYRVDGLRSSTL